MVVSFIHCIYQNLLKVSENKSLTISLSFEYISRTLNLVSDFYDLIYKLSFWRLPQRLETCYPFFQGSVVISEENRSLFVSSSFQPLGFALITFILKGIVVLLPFPFIYLWGYQDRLSLSFFFFCLSSEVLWALLRYILFFLVTTVSSFFLYSDPSSLTQTSDALLTKY